MTPQINNRQALLDGAIRCIGERDYAEVTTREIAAASNANISSIAYHFGSKDGLVAEALQEGFRRWLASFAAETSKIHSHNPKERLQQALGTLGERLARERQLASAFISALSYAVHHEELRVALAEVFGEMRRGLSGYLRLGQGEFGELRASLLIAVFDGLLIQWLVEPSRVSSDIRRLQAMLDEMPDSFFQAIPPSSD